MQFFENSLRRRRTVVATHVTNSGDKMLQQRPHLTGLIFKPSLLVVLKFYWLDILNLRRMCNKKVAG